MVFVPYRGFVHLNMNTECLTTRKESFRPLLGLRSFKSSFNAVSRLLIKFVFVPYRGFVHLNQSTDTIISREFQVFVPYRGFVHLNHD